MPLALKVAPAVRFHLSLNVSDLSRSLDFYRILFGMLGRLEHEDMGALVAPRPLLVETGREDLLFPVAAATESVRRTRLDLPVP